MHKGAKASVAGKKGGSAGRKEEAREQRRGYALTHVRANRVKLAR